MSLHSTISRRDDIDGLRAIDVGAVVAFHAFPSVLPGGFVGVDVFFVISGYLISGIILLGLGQGTFSFLTFYYRRIRRIFPALLVVLLGCFLVGWTSGAPRPRNACSRPMRRHSSARRRDGSPRRQAVHEVPRPPRSIAGEADREQAEAGNEGEPRTAPASARASAAQPGQPRRRHRR
jgi:hypothetical protein